MSYKLLLEKILNNQNLSEHEASGIFGKIMSGNLSDAQISGFTVALRAKGETSEEITGFVKEMRKRMKKIEFEDSSIVDTCGTGGDGKNTFNISTISAFVAAGAGSRVAKHGNRAVSSNSGSADLLESLGVNISLSPEKVKESIEKVGIGFFFAPVFHESMKYAAQVRREIGIKTVFNILGPLSNPAQTKRQLIGVFDKNLTETFANILKKLGNEHSLIVHGEDGMDEITITGKTKSTELKNGKISTYYIDPEDFGIKKAPIEQLIVKNKEDSKDILFSVLNGERGPRRDVVLLNSGAAIYISGKAKSIAEGINMAKDSIDTNKALKKIDELIDFTNC